MSSKTHQEGMSCEVTLETIRIKQWVTLKKRLRVRLGAKPRVFKQGMSGLVVQIHPDHVKIEFGPFETKPYTIAVQLNGAQLATYFTLGQCSLPPRPLHEQGCSNCPCPECSDDVYDINDAETEEPPEDDESTDDW